MYMHSMCIPRKLMRLMLRFCTSKKESEWIQIFRWQDLKIIQMITYGRRELISLAQMALQKHIQNGTELTNLSNNLLFRRDKPSCDHILPKKNVMNQTYFQMAPLPRLPNIKT